MKNFGLIISLLFSGLLLTGCNKTVVENCGDDCINESDIDVLEHKCMEYVNNAMFYNIEASASRTNHYFYDNSGSMEYTFTDAEFSGTYYGIKGYVKAGDKSQNFICNIYTGGGLHDLYFYNDKSNNEEPIEECKRYFDGCNRCTMQDDGERICTEEACEEYEEAYCADEQYDEFLEDIRSNIPLCNDIDINRDAEIIEIDDVVENCTYEEGTAYSWDKGGCGGVMPQLYITKEKLGMFDLSDTEVLCKSQRAGIIRDLGGHYSDINTFVYKYGLYKKGLIDSVLPQTEEEIGGNKCGFYYCDDENLCSQFYRPSYGDNENHYYIYGYRYTEDFPYEIVLVVDDKLYGLGKLEGISENGWPNTRKQGRRIVYGLDGDKLIVKRYVDGELIPPYTLENFNSYSFPEKTTTTKFKVKTCEIPL